MSADVIQLAHGKVLRSPISFYCDLSCADAPVIPLGVIVEVLLPGLRGLGAIARTELAEEESRRVEKLGRELLVNPGAYIVEAFDDAWDNAPAGEALSYLAAKYPYALHFAVPETLDLPKRFLATPPNERELVTFMAELLDDEAYELTPPGVRRRRLFELEAT